MTPPLTFHSFVGNRRAVSILLRAVDRDRLPHALIFAGPPGVGKRALALLLARLLNCLQPRNSEACNECTSCRKIMGAMHPDVRVIEPDGSFIKIGQVRELINEIAYQPFEGRFRVAILDPADQMRVEAANCLLKSLEEPPSRSILVLITPKPHLLLATIRSRSWPLRFGTIEEKAIETYLTQHGGRNPADARVAAALSNGSLGTALVLDAELSRELRKQALHFVSLLLSRENFTAASALAEKLAKEKGGFLDWLEIAAILLQDVYYAQVAPARMSQLDIADELSRMAQSASHAAVVSCIEAVKSLKAAMPLNVNRQLALESLFLAQTDAGTKAR
jgi:DNA polymerase III subunit delta'